MTPSMTVQRTLARTITQVADNVIRHAPARCRVDLHTFVFDHE